MKTIQLKKDNSKRIFDMLYNANNINVYSAVIPLDMIEVSKYSSLKEYVVRFLKSVNDSDLDIAYEPRTKEQNAFVYIDFLGFEDLCLTLFIEDSSVFQRLKAEATRVEHAVTDEHGDLALYEDVSEDLEDNYIMYALDAFRSDVSKVVVSKA